MTFIENPEDSIHNHKEFQTDDKEQKRFKSFMLFGLIVLLIPIFYFTICAFLPAKKVSKEAVVFKTTAYKTTTKDLAKDKELGFNTLTKTVFEEKNELLELIETKNIFKISSSKPEGFYVMVGSFKAYENAQKLEKMNPTNYVCYIFEPNYKNFNRVGLFISKDDLRKTENALQEIKNMQPESWILYNSLN